jgi:hypothetical protein
MATRKKGKSKASTSKALVRVTRRPPTKVEVLPPAGPNGYIVAADGSLQLGALGLVELKLTPHEEQVLSERVNPDDVQWRPSRKDGPKDIPYLPHHVYTRWLNRAFGRIGWNLVPVSKPMKTEQNVVMIAYVLHAHKLPVAFAWGEQEYFDRKSDGSESRHQSYGDVVESTVASALRRCMKHLGVGLELWDKTWVEQLKRPGQPPAPARKRNGNGRPAPVEHADLDAKITDDQRLKLWNTSRRVGRGDSEVQEWLRSRYGLKTSTDITRRQFDDIITFIERPGPLPAGERS